MANAKVGMRGVASYDVTGERPQSYREGIMYLYPNGALTTLIAQMKGRKVDDTHIHWYTEKYRTKSAALSSSGVYTDLLFSSAVSATNTAAGAALAARCTSEFASWLKPGHVVLLRTAIDHSGDMPVRVTSVIRGTDATSGFGFVTLKADLGASATATLVTADRAIIMGTAHAQGSNRPEAISYQPTHHTNVTQIFRTSMNITRTAMRTRLRTEPAYMKIKKQAMEDHAIEMEDAFLHGYLSEGFGDNGEPLNTTMGIIPFIRAYAPENVLDYRLHADYSGQTWDAGGEEFLYDAIQQSFLWGNEQEKLVVCGAGAIKAVQNTVKNNSMYTIKNGEKSYGINVNRLETPFGVWNLKLNARMTHESSNTNSMVVLEPKNLEYCYIDDTSFEPDIMFGKGGGTGKDGKEEGFITECGLEMHHPETFMYLSNLGVTNVA